jgi:nicotinamide-nucleotide amidase
VQLATELVALLTEREETICTAESLTGGLLCATLVAVSGASQVVRGGIVAYTLAAKHEVVGVPEVVLREHGAVAAETARALADRARSMFGSTWAVSTTGVAGPDRQEGKPVGTVFVGVSGPACGLLELHLPGDRTRIRQQTCASGIALVHNLME